MIIFDQMCYNHKYMPSKNTEKKIDPVRELQTNISPVLVINNSTLKPYIELFEYAPENIYQQPLGHLIGFFEIKEYSDDSAYVVNFLTSVLKKEYYANPKRPVAESFDSALHKVNLALSEVAKHGNVEWIGKIHAAICVIEKNSIHFTIAGNAKIFLNRKQTLTDISEDLASDENEPHPLKTFINVSSGRLEKEDRLIITSEDIFHILKLSDLKKNLQRLTKEQFVQFLKTALSNELEMIATIVADFTEIKKNSYAKNAAKKEAVGKEAAINVFSEAAFAGQPAAKKELHENFEQIKNTSPAIEYTDKKTGHIYVQGGSPPEEMSQIEHYWETIAEKMSDGWRFTKNSTRRNFNLYKKELEKKIEQAKVKNELRKKQLAEEKELELERLEQLKQEEVINAQELGKNLHAEQSPPEIAAKKSLTEIINLKEKLDSSEKNPETFQEEIIEEVAEQPTAKTAAEKIKPTSYLVEKIQPLIPKVTTFAILILGNLKKLKRVLQQWLAIRFEKTKTSNIKLSKIVPHLSKIKSLYFSLSKKQKTNVFISLIIIFIVPIFIANWLNRPKPATIKELPKIELLPQEEKLTTEKNISSTGKATTLLTNSNIVGILNANDNIIAVTKKSLLVLKDNQPTEYPFPDNSGSAVRYTYMPDLFMVFVFTDQAKLLSFTPSNAKFTENKIDLSGISTNSFIGTYLTYLYVLDPSSNQLLRYPRAEGGFGEKTNWLKETATLTGISDMIIDENIYTIQNNQVLKFFKGKTEPFALEAASTPVNFDKIFTTINSTFLYALDKKNSRIVKYDKASGSIAAQFPNEAFRDGTAFAVDEKTNTAYITTSSGLVSILLQ